MDGDTIIVVRQPLTRNSPEDHLSDTNLTVPAILVSICCLFTGIPATLYAMKAQKYYQQGRWREGEDYQRRARGWITFTVIIGLVNIAIVLILRQIYVS